MKDSEATRDIHWPAGVCWMENIIEGIRNFKLKKKISAAHFAEQSDTIKQCRE